MRLWVKCLTLSVPLVEGMVMSVLRERRCYLLQHMVVINSSTFIIPFEMQNQRHERMRLLSPPAAIMATSISFREKIIFTIMAYICYFSYVRSGSCCCLLVTNS